jgi:hypothetical protein
MPLAGLEAVFLKWLPDRANFFQRLSAKAVFAGENSY